MMEFNEEPNYEQFLNLLMEKAKDGVPDFSLSKIEYSFLGINKIQDTSAKNRFMSGANIMVARLMNSLSAEQDIIPRVLMLGGISGHFPEQTSLLSDGQLDLLIEFSHQVRPNEMDEHMQLFGHQPLLETVCNKTGDFKERLVMLDFIEDKYFDFDIDHNNLAEMDKFKYESCIVIKNTSKEELVERGTVSSYSIEKDNGDFSL